MNIEQLQEFPQSLAKQGFALFENSLSVSDTDNLLKYAIYEKEENKFRPARIGKGDSKILQQSIRGDEILWIDHDKHKSLSPLLTLCEEIQYLCRRELFLPIKRFESHFAHYPPQMYYKKHCDRHLQSPSRLISMVIYLSQWEEGNGGELVIYNEGEQTYNFNEPVIIRPQKASLILFDSRLMHEVLTTNQNRWSIVTWFRDDLHPGILI